MLKKIELPSIEQAIAMAEDREKWAEEAMDKDMPGTAKELQLTAALLRYYAEETT